MITVKNRVGLAVLCAVGIVPLAVAYQNDGIEWSLEPYVSSIEKPAVLALAREMGLDAPKRIAPYFPLPVGMNPECPLLLIESVVAVNGRHRSWAELVIQRQGRSGGEECVHIDPDIRQVGLWTADIRSYHELETWRVEDGDWHVDVFVEPTVSPAAVEQIVMAIRSRTLVNRLPTNVGPLTINPAIPDIDPDDINRISRSSTDASEYEVSTGLAIGLKLKVRIVGDTVELLGVALYIA